jgi:uncharacterized membrane protein YidH (DUF202 family)
MSGSTEGQQLADQHVVRRPAAGRPRGGRGWIAFGVVNCLIIFFGLSYVFFPMGTVEADGNHTTGVLEVPREIWGSYVVVSGLAMLALALYAFRTRRRRARNALAYEFLFLAVVAAVEPDLVVPTVFAVVLGFFLYRARSWFDR